jgi:hypothetical protein
MRACPIVLLLVAACGGGGGPQLSNLRCRDPLRCQHPEDPFRVLLAVDFDDETGTLAQGALDLRINGNTQVSVSLQDLFAAQSIVPGTKKGTLQVDEEFVLDRVTQGESVKVGLLATNGQGRDSNEPSLTFTLHLGP